MNILLPISPLFLRLFIIFLSKEHISKNIELYELPELLFFSIFTCIVGLNINLNGKKKYFENILRLLLMIILILDFVALGMIYSNNAGSNTPLFSITSALIPMIIAPLYKIYNLKSEKRDE